MRTYRLRTNNFITAPTPIPNRYLSIILIKPINRIFRQMLYSVSHGVIRWVHMHHLSKSHKKQSFRPLPRRLRRARAHLKPRAHIVRA